MKKVSYLILLTCLISVSAHAQKEEAKVTEVINRLFTAMATADSSLLRTAFSEDVTMASIYKNKEGKQMVTRETSINDFVTSVGKSQSGVLAEEIWNVQVQIDRDFAQVWCDYAFYYQKKFSHCGVDAFHLVKTTEGWKIFHLADTRWREGCHVPDEIQNKY